MFYHTKSLCLLAEGSAPTPDFMVKVAHDGAPSLHQRDTVKWRLHSQCWKLLAKVNQMAIDGKLNKEQNDDFKQDVVYWMEHFPILPAKVMRRLKKWHFHKMGCPSTRAHNELNNAHKSQPWQLGDTKLREPQKLADFDYAIWADYPLRSKRIAIMQYLHLAVYGQAEAFIHSDSSRQMVQLYLGEFPEFFEEVMSVRPALLKQASIDDYHKLQEPS